MAPPPTHINPINNTNLLRIPLSADRNEPQKSVTEEELSALRELIGPASYPALNLFEGLTPFDHGTQPALAKPPIERC